MDNNGGLNNVNRWVNDAKGIGKPAFYGVGAA